jgi:hypothetical protein
MYCPGCSIQVTEDLKFCKNCGANLRGVRDAMLSREEKSEWRNPWLAQILLAKEAQERLRGLTPEKRRYNEMRGGVITTFVGFGVTIFLYFLLNTIADVEGGRDAEILRKVWLAGVIPILVGLAIFFNGLIFGKREVKLEEQRRRTLQTPTAGPLQPMQNDAKTTNNLLISPDYGVTEETTAHLPDPINTPSREERD